MVELTFKTEIKELREIFEKHGFVFGGDIDGLLKDLDAFLESVNEHAINYVKENRGEFGLRSESDSPVGT